MSTESLRRWGTKRQRRRYSGPRTLKEWEAVYEAPAALKKKLAAAAWREANAERRRGYQLLRRLEKYGLSYERYLSMRGQTKTCCICLVREPAAIDHCHRTGVVRGLLCSRCNGALGLFDDDPAALRRAAAYLEEDRSGVPSTRP